MTAVESLDLEGPFPRPREEKYDPERARDRIRGPLAIGMVMLLGATMLLTYIWIAANWMNTGDAKDILGIVLPPVVALTGTVLGFYFGGTDRP